MTNVRTAKTAADLTAIVELATTSRRAHRRPTLLAQAVGLAGARVDRSPLPGGAAMVALAPVADLDVWERRAAISARPGVPAREVRTAIDLEDPEDAWPPLQVLRYWSDPWRARTHQPTGHPTLATEATWLRRHLDDAHDRLTGPEWAAFATSVADVRRRLEDVLADGERVERGVPCMDPDCGGRRLIRKLQPARDDQGRKVWRHSEWHCSSCRRRYGPVEYRTMVAAANARAQRETFDVRHDLLEGAAGTMVVEVETTWCSVAYAASVVGRPEATIRSWVHRGDVSAGCIVAGRRTGFVCLDDVLSRDGRARVRGARRATGR